MEKKGYGDFLDLILVSGMFSITLPNANDHLRLHRPMFRTKSYGGRAFSSCAPTLWNSLPLDVRSALSIETFKVRLKTFIFNNEL